MKVWAYVSLAAFYLVVIASSWTPAVARGFVTIREFVGAVSTLREVEKIAPDKRGAFMKSHRVALERATIIVSAAEAVWDTLDEANKEALHYYKRAFLCGMPSEEDNPDLSVEALVQVYLAKARKEHAIAPGSAEDRALLETPVHLAVMDAMMEHYLCHFD